MTDVAPIAYSLHTLELLYTALRKLLYDRSTLYNDASARHHGLPERTDRLRCHVHDGRGGKWQRNLRHT